MLVDAVELRERVFREVGTSPGDLVLLAKAVTRERDVPADVVVDLWLAERRRVDGDDVLSGFRKYVADMPDNLSAAMLDTLLARLLDNASSDGDKWDARLPLSCRSSSPRAAPRKRKRWPRLQRPFRRRASFSVPIPPWV